MAKAAKQQENVSEGSEATQTHVVIAEFRDINDFTKVYYPDDDVSHFDKQRLADLIDKRLVKKNDE